jgi:hypothetical protein
MLQTPRLVFRDAVVIALHLSLPSRYALLAGLRFVRVNTSDSRLTASVVSFDSTVISSVSFAGFGLTPGYTSSFVTKHLPEVCPLTRGAMFHAPIHPITGWHSLFPSSYTRRLSFSLAASLPISHGILPLEWETISGLTTFRISPAEL